MYNITFHVCSIIFLLLYTLQPADHQKFSFHPSPYSCQPYSYNICYPFCPSHPSALVATTLFSVSTCLFLFGLVCSFVFYIPCEQNHMVLYFSDLFHLAWYPQGASVLSQMARFHLFNDWVVFHCIYNICHIFFIHPFFGT